MLLRKGLFLISFLILITLLNSCEKDDPISTHEDHFESIGMAFFDSTNSKVASILRGSTTDTIKIRVGKNSGFLTAKFYDDNENLFEPEEEPDHVFNWEMKDNSVAFIQKDLTNQFRIKITGTKTGITQVEFFVEHEGHADFRSGKINLSVK